MEYNLPAFVTLASAVLGTIFAVSAVRTKDGPKTVSFYLLARSVALTAAALVPIFIKSAVLLAVLTGVMLTIQILDGMVGICIKNPLRTWGPFIMAALHGASLYLVCGLLG